MATCTAMAFFGRHDRDHGGIQIMHMIRLYENSMSHLVIETPTGVDHDGKMLGHWHPTGNTLDDMMLFAAYYALKDQAVIDACRVAGCPENTIEKSWVLFDAKESLPSLYGLAKQALHKSQAKLVLVRLNESSLGDMTRAADYLRDVELCPSVYDRHFCEWGSSLVTAGSPDAVPSDRLEAVR